MAKRSERGSGGGSRLSGGRAPAGPPAPRARPRVVRVGYRVDGFGVGELWAADGRLVWHELPRPRPLHASSEVAGAHREPVGSVTIAELTEVVQAYFRGERVSFDGVELDLDWCTPFQAAVAKALRATPYGETVTYAELAALAGYPNAQRAAGTFCARNRFPLVLPCHRVVAADGLGSYGALGVGVKRRLLAVEGAL